MRRELLVLVVLLSNATFAISQTMFQPEKTIVMTVTFSSAVEPGAIVSVSYRLKTPQLADQSTFGNQGLEFKGDSSADNKTFTLKSTVTKDTPTGDYKFLELDISKTGLQQGTSINEPSAPVIRIENSGKDPKKITVPSFEIQVK